MGRLLTRYLLRRFEQDRGRGSSSSTQSGRRARRTRYPSRRSGRVGLFGPFPYYSTRTRRGSRVTVGGCCLPLVLAPLLAPTVAVVAHRRRRR